MIRIKYILITVLITFGVLFSYSGTLDDSKKLKPDDDKKAKTKRDDTSHVQIETEDLLSDEVPDSLHFLFPSHDLYTTFDTSIVHPYNFYNEFKVDSAELTLVKEGENNFVMPFTGSITSGFGWRRYRPHYGTDIGLKTGDIVVTAFDGMVRFAKYCGGYGYCVIVRHNNGLESVYAHLSKILVEPGQLITAGSIIGLGGNTGHSFGSHLHLEFRYLGQSIDTEDIIDYTKGELKSNTFIVRKNDVESKYDLRALHTRHRRDLAYARRGAKNAKITYAAVKGIYKVRKGDTLGAIAKRNHTTVNSLCKKNGLKPNTVLKLGQRVKI
ncbi:MAG: peptidoglycan DD-metalloendopeptidase family protein [Bacteroidetes bacterium]|nr:peptidoglycan DD-metalloendopeptidase family protein [Bacteroidota bacterium]